MRWDRDGSNRLVVGGLLAIVSPDIHFPWWLTIACAVTGFALLVWGGYVTIRHYRR